MRRCCFLFLYMLAVSVGMIPPSESQAPRSSPSGQMAKKATAKKPEAAPTPQAAAATPACKGGDLVALHHLNAKDAETLKSALASQFDCLLPLPSNR